MTQYSVLVYSSSRSVTNPYALDGILPTSWFGDNEDPGTAASVIDSTVVRQTIEPEQRPAVDFRLRIF